MSKRLGGIEGCKYKTSSWHSNWFPDADNIGSTVFLTFSQPEKLIYTMTNPARGLGKDSKKGKSRMSYGGR